MTPDTPPNPHPVRVCVGYFRWDSTDRHHLAVDLSGPLPEWEWVVGADGVLVPVDEYLGRQPGRREEVRQQIRRFESTDQEPAVRMRSGQRAGAVP